MISDGCNMLRNGHLSNEYHHVSTMLLRWEWSNLTVVMEVNQTFRVNKYLPGRKMREDEEALKRCFRNYKVRDCENTNKTFNMIIAVWVLRTMLRNWGGIRECCWGGWLRLAGKVIWILYFKQFFNQWGEWPDNRHTILTLTAF